jgi:phosphoribosylglycinamide formyltransferase-1
MGLFRIKFRIALLVSGRGSNLEAVIKAIEAGYLKNVKIVMVISDNRDAKALEICARHKIKAIYVNPGDFKTKLEGPAEDKYIKILKGAKADLIVLAGFMRIIKKNFINSFSGRIINIHPSLLPRHPGLHTHRKALEAGDLETGCSVHFVNEVTDGGKIIMQARVPILPGDTEDTLAARVLEKEHILLPEVIKMLSEKKLNYGSVPENPLILGEN